jgi:2',3'-cyclic-nucleotide 2'-phosphodiesterase (5'-nucleotidase family)
MKKILLVFITILSTFTLIACTKYSSQNIAVDDDILPYLNIYYLNDTHGAILSASDQIGLSSIANLTTQEEEYTIVLSGGDMFQGTALSNYYQGKSMIEIMNTMSFDAMALGTHEFDWGLETVTRYFEEDNDEYVADFPLLAANAFYKGTETIPEGIEPYTIIQKGSLNIGVIGAIGSGLESSIATAMIEDYEFKNPFPYIEEYATYLRSEEQVDLVLVVLHESSNSLNSQLAYLEGDAKIDGIFNAHAHQVVNTSINNIPILQSGDNGEMVGYMQYQFNDDYQDYTYTIDNLRKEDQNAFYSTYAPTQALIDTYVAETDDLFNEVLMISGANLSHTELSIFIAEVMKNATNSDIGFQNGGGTRNSIDANETIDLSLLYQIWPFDNIVKTVYLNGAQIKNMMDYYIYQTDITNFDDDTLYKVATNDYVFDKPDNPFIYGEDIVNTYLNMRELAYKEIQLQSYIYDFFQPSNEVQITEESLNE